MKFQMILDQEKEEAVFARVHKRTALVDEIEKLVLEGGQGRTIAGYDEDGIRMLEIGAVEAFYVEGDKTFAAYQGGKYRVRKRLYELEEVLPEYFRRINKSNLANMKKIVRFNVTLSGAVNAEFESGFSDYISRRCFVYPLSNVGWWLHGAVRQFCLSCGRVCGMRTRCRSWKWERLS